jgi:hypothetical protein
MGIKIEPLLGAGTSSEIIMFNLVLLLSFLTNAAGYDPRAISPHTLVRPVVPAAVAMVPTPVSVSSFKSYREWKAEQLAYWQSRGQAEMAKELTVADYFAGYLTKQRDQAQAIKDVSARLSADEVAELMTIYANSVFGSHSPQVPYQANLPIREISK